MATPRSIPRTTTALLLVLVATATPLAGQDKVDVRGVITDRATGKAIAGAAIGVVDGWQVAFTDQNGRFVLKDVPVGSIELRAAQLGYGEWSATHSIDREPHLLDIALDPDPVILEGIQVTSDRLRARRNAIPYSVRAYTADQIRTSPAFDAFDFVRERTALTQCAPSVHGSYCVLHRGRYVYPRVFVDDAPWLGGLDALRGFSTYDVYLVEVIGRTQIRVYTQNFAKLLASGRTRLSPVLIF